MMLDAMSELQDLQNVPGNAQDGVGCKGLALAFKAIHIRKPLGSASERRDGQLAW